MGKSARLFTAGDNPHNHRKLSRHFGSRLLACVLTLVMVLGMLPMTALAAGAATPTFITDLSATPVSYNVGATAAQMEVGVTVSDGGSWAVQWYSYKSNPSEASPISGAKYAYFRPSTESTGTTYYYAVATNTKDGATADAKSTTACVSVFSGPTVPVFTTNLSMGIVSCYVGDPASALTAAACIGDTGKLTYQWYSYTDDPDNAAAITGATGTSYTPSTSSAGITNYYVAATDTLNGQCSITQSNTKTVSVAQKSDAVAYSGQTATGNYSISSAAQLQQLSTAVVAGNTYAGSTFTLTQTISLSDVCNVTAGSWVPIGATIKQGWSSIAHHFCGTFDGGGNTVQDLYINSGTIDQGLFGVVTGGIIENLNVTGSVTVTGNYAYSGSLIGELGSGIIRNCSSSVNVTGINSIGGIVGNCGGTAEGCTFSGTLTSTGGGAGGIASSGGTIRNCVNTGTVTSKTGGCGGIIGSENSATVTGCVNTGTVTTTAAAQNVGGIAGSLYDGSITNCINRGALNPYTGSSRFGGIVGYNSNAAGIISRCFNAAPVVTLGAITSTNISGVYYLTANSTDGENGACTGVASEAAVMADKGIAFFYNEAGSQLKLSAQISGFSPSAFTGFSIGTTGLTQKKWTKDIPFAFDMSGLTATASLGGVSYRIGLANLTYDTSAVNTSIAGTYPIGVCFGGVTKTYNLQVIEENYTVNIQFNK